MYCVLCETTINSSENYFSMKNKPICESCKDNLRKWFNWSMR